MSSGNGYDNDNVGPFPPAVFVLIVIIAAGAAVVVAYAVSRFYSGAEPEMNTSPSQEQESYMREVRNRNYDHILGQIRGGRRQYGGPTFNGAERGDTESSVEY